MEATDAATSMAVADRIQIGRARRTELSRGVHADWAPSPTRRDPVEILLASNEGRLPELVPIRFGRMSVSPFAFLRGSAAVMTSDLATTPTTGLKVQACGDCHLMNFGLFATPERNVVFGLNDFDETLPGPWEWDVKRLAASFVVAGRDGRVGEANARAAAEAAIGTYRRRMWDYTAMSPLAIWYDRLDLKKIIEEAPDKKARLRREQVDAQARRRVADNLFPKLATIEGGRMKIMDQPPLIFHPPEPNFEEMARQFIATYRASLAADRRLLFDRYRYEDGAIKVVGVGSVGTRCFVTLFSNGGGNPLVLQVKEANQSVLEPYVGAGEIQHNGQRIVVGQHLMQPASDIFLGWGTGPAGREFYVRQLRDMKLSVTLSSDPTLLRRYAEFCGLALARAHANTGDPAAIAGYLGHSDRFDRAIGQFAVAYADQTERDYAALRTAISDGKVEVIEETV